MRTSLCALALIALFIPCIASAQVSTTPGYTNFDRQQFAKLHYLVGTWKCVDIRASKKPDTQTVKQVGNFIVMREAGDGPNTEYTRWSHSYKMYYTVEIDDDGGTNVSMTKELDPFNSTWSTAFPSRMPDAKPYFAKPFPPMSVKSTGSTITYAGQYYDDKGRIKSFRSTCTKAT